MRKMMKQAAAVLSAVMTLAAGNSCLALTKNITVTTDSENTQFAVCTVIYTDSETGAEDFESLTADNFESSFTSVQTKEILPGTETVEFTVNIGDDAPKGKYIARITKIDAAGTAQTEDTVIYNLTDEDMQSVIDGLHGSQTPLVNIQELEDMGFIASGLAAKANAAAGFEEIFESVKTEKYNEGYTSASDAEKNIRLALAIETFRLAQAAEIESLLADETTLQLFADEGISEEQLKLDGFAEAFVKLRNAENLTVDALKNEMNVTTVIITLASGTHEEKTDALKNNAGLLGIDISKADAEGISLTEIAKLTNGNTPAEIESSYNAALQQLITEKAQSVTKVTGGTGGGGGGGSKKSSGVTISPVQVKQPETKVKAEEVAAPSFTDVPESHWAFEAVGALAKNGIISKADSFRESDSITRGEFVKLAVLSLKKEMTGKDPQFSDSKKTDWYYPYVCSAFNAGIINGQSENYFGAGNPITREDAAVIIARCIGIKAAEGIRSEFSDDADIASYAAPMIAELKKINMVSGVSEGVFGAKHNITRAQAAQMFYNMITYLAKNGGAA